MYIASNYEKPIITEEAQPATTTATTTAEAQSPEEAQPAKTE